MTELKLSATSSKASDDSDNPDEASSRFHCPLTGKPMNGAHRFVFIRTSGAVMSESGLKAIISEASNATKRGDAASPTAAIFECPITSTPFHAGSLLGKNGAAAQDADNVGDIILLNPSEAEEGILRAALAKHREANAASKSKSSGADPSSAGSKGEAKRSREEGAEDRGDGGKKQKRPSPPSGRDSPSSGNYRANSASGDRAASPPSAATASANRIAALAAQQAKSKPMSKALASIYGVSADGNKKVQEKESWLVRGTGLGR